MHLHLKADSKGVIPGNLIRGFSLIYNLQLLSNVVLDLPAHSKQKIRPFLAPVTVSSRCLPGIIALEEECFADAFHSWKVPETRRRTWPLG